MSIAIPPTNAGIYLNLVTGISDFSPVMVPGWDFSAFQSSVAHSGLSFFGNGAAGSLAAVAASGSAAVVFNPGDSIGPANNPCFAGVVGTIGTAFRTDGVHYVGIRFTDESTAATYYGYVELTTSAPAGFPAKITRYVYDATGVTIIIAGSPPPPAFVSAASRKVQGAIAFNLPLTP